MSGTTSSSIKSNPDEYLEKISEEIISGTATLTDISPYETRDYIKCVGDQIEQLEGRWKLAYVRCPKCREYISVYKDEIDSDGITKPKRCLCGFKKCLKLKKWRTRN